MHPAVDAQATAVERLNAEKEQLRERLRNAEQHTARTLMRATRLAQVVGVLGNHADVDRTIEETLVEMSELFSCDIAVLLLESGHDLKVAGSWGIPAAELPDAPIGLEALKARVSQQSVGLDSAAEVWLPDWLTRFAPLHVAWARLSVADKPLGMILLLRRADESFELEEANELRAIAYRIALAIENGLLHKHMRGQLAQLRRLQELTAELTGAMEPATIGRLVAETLVAEVGVKAGCVFVVDGGEPRLLASSGLTELDGEDPPDQPDRLPAGWEQFALTVADRTVGTIAVSSPPPPHSECEEMLRHLVGLGALALEKALLYQQSREHARHDSLTGLLGHRVFQQTLEHLLTGRQPFSVVLFDIDDFKEINDLHGHGAGDEVLRLVADVMRQGMRAGDSVFRVGGEEFYAVLPGTAADDAFTIAERLRSMVAAAAADRSHPVTLSGGVANFPDHAAERDELLARADVALYASKRAGKDRTTISGASVTAPEQAPAPARAHADDRAVRLDLLLAKDPDTVTHSIHTAILAVNVGRRLGLDPPRLANLRIAAKLHDIGKLGIPDTILLKAGPLDDDEFLVVKTHPVVGAELLKAWGFTEPARFVLQHHERVDGTGYPHGLHGDEITLESRIIHVVDAYTAMTLDRPYRTALGRDQAFAELTRHRGTQFDPAVVDALLAIEADVRTVASRAAA